MDIKDSYWVNVSWRFRVVLIFGFAVTLTNVVILTPLKFCLGREYLTRKGRVEQDWRGQIRN